LLETDPDDRTVVVFVDYTGARGKTKFTQYGVATHGWMGATPNDKKANAMLFDGQKVVLVNVPRQAHTAICRCADLLHYP
jgi:hypothetical protein